MKLPNDHRRNSNSSAGHYFPSFNEILSGKDEDSNSRSRGPSITIASHQDPHSYKSSMVFSRRQSEQNCQQQLPPSQVKQPVNRPELSSSNGLYMPSFIMQSPSKQEAGTHGIFAPHGLSKAYLKQSKSVEDLHPSKGTEAKNDLVRFQERRAVKQRIYEQKRNNAQVLSNFAKRSKSPQVSSKLKMSIGMQKLIQPDLGQTMHVQKQPLESQAPKSSMQRYKSVDALPKTSYRDLYIQNLRESSRSPTLKSVRSAKKINWVPKEPLQREPLADTTTATVNRLIKAPSRPEEKPIATRMDPRMKPRRFEKENKPPATAAPKKQQPEFSKYFLNMLATADKEQSMKSLKSAQAKDQSVDYDGQYLRGIGGNHKKDYINNYFRQNSTKRKEDTGPKILEQTDSSQVSNLFKSSSCLKDDSSYQVQTTSTGDETTRSSRPAHPVQQPQIISCSQAPSQSPFEAYKQQRALQQDEPIPDDASETRSRVSYSQPGRSGATRSAERANPILSSEENIELINIELQNLPADIDSRQINQEYFPNAHVIQTDAQFDNITGGCTGKAKVKVRCQNGLRSDAILKQLYSRGAKFEVKTHSRQGDSRHDQAHPRMNQLGPQHANYKKNQWLKLHQTVAEREQKRREEQAAAAARQLQEIKRQSILYNNLARKVEHPRSRQLPAGMSQTQNNSCQGTKLSDSKHCSQNEQYSQNASQQKDRQQWTRPMTNDSSRVKWNNENYMLNQDLKTQRSGWNKSAESTQQVTAGRWNQSNLSNQHHQLFSPEESSANFESLANQSSGTQPPLADILARNEKKLNSVGDRKKTKRKLAAGINTDYSTSTLKTMANSGSAAQLTTAGQTSSSGGVRSSGGQRKVHVQATSRLNSTWEISKQGQAENRVLHHGGGIENEPLQANIIVENHPVSYPESTHQMSSKQQSMEEKLLDYNLQRTLRPAQARQPFTSGLPKKTSQQAGSRNSASLKYMKMTQSYKNKLLFA